MANQQEKNTNATYEIKFQGHLDNQWSEWFYDLTITHERDGATTLSGPLPDQAALHSVLDRIQDMNLPLIWVKRILSEEGTTGDVDKGASHAE